MLLGVCLGAAAVCPWPRLWTDALVHLGEPVERIRWALALAAGVFLLFALAYHPLARLLPWLDCRMPRAVLAGAAVVLVIAAAVPRIYWPVRYVKLGAPDHIEYAVGARNLLERGAYTIELNGREHPPRYPYGYSAFFVAPVLAPFSDELRYAVYASLLCALGVLLLMTHIVGRHFGKLSAIATVGVLLFCPVFVKYATEVFAEQAAILCFLLVVIWSVAPVATRRRAFFLGLFVGLSAAVKLSLGLLVLLPLAGILASRWAWKETLAVAAAVFFGAGLGAAPLLITSAVRFGSPLRTGYHYWCSIPYDFPTLTFSARYLFHPADGEGPGSLVAYLLARGWLPAQPRVESIGTIAFWSLVFPGAVVAWRQNGPARRYVLLVMVAAALFLGFYGLYFFQDIRFLLPVYVALVPLAAWGVERLLAVPESLRRSGALGVLLAAALCIATWMPGPRWSRASNQPLRELSGARQQLVEAAARILPQDALIVSNLDGLIVGHYLLRGTERDYLPLDRRVEYASKYVQPRAPGSLRFRLAASSIDDPFDHRAVQLPGAVEAYPVTAIESLSNLAERARNGTPCYLVVEGPTDEGAARRIQERLGTLSRHFALQPIERDLLIWKMVAH